MDTEIWKDIIGYEGIYQISSLSRVKSLKFGKEKILVPGFDRGYQSYVLSYLGLKNKFISSRLVALHFIPNPINLPLVCHKDETLDENGALYNGSDNLYWGTHSDNMFDKYRKGRANNHFQTENHPMKGRFGKYHHRHKQVLQYSICGKFIRKWDSISDACRELGLRQSHISSVCNGNRKSTGNFIWKF